jgi:hypothetical protein
MNKEIGAAKIECQKDLLSDKSAINFYFERSGSGAYMRT